jgi:hypothetical protein
MARSKKKVDPETGKSDGKNERLIKVYCSDHQYGIISTAANFEDKTPGEFILAYIVEEALKKSKLAVKRYEELLKPKDQQQKSDASPSANKPTQK